MNNRTRALKNNLNPDLWENRTPKELDVYLEWKKDQPYWLAKRVEKMPEDERAVYEDNEFDEDSGVGYTKTGAFIMFVIISFVLIVGYNILK